MHDCRFTQTAFKQMPMFDFMLNLMSNRTIRGDVRERANIEQPISVFMVSLGVIFHLNLRPHVAGSIIPSFAQIRFQISHCFAPTQAFAIAPTEADPVR